MLLSELIRSLQDIYDASGDLPVMVADEECDEVERVRGTVYINAMMCGGCMKPCSDCVYAEDQA